MQHPQEPDKDLGTAKLLHLALPSSTLKIGLSWPNLSKALGHPAHSKEWGVLYLGSKANADRKDSPIFHDVPLKGFVVLDGTWSQAKTLWWRNPWLLKLQRMILSPTRPSLYGQLRKEPRRECLSTLEAVAKALSHLENSDVIELELTRVLQKLLELYSSSNKRSHNPLTL